MLGFEFRYPADQNRYKNFGRFLALYGALLETNQWPISAVLRSLSRQDTSMFLIHTRAVDDTKFYPPPL